MGNWGNWCCHGKCWSISDDFNGVDGTDLGSFWDERSGNWLIDTLRLKEAGNAGALVICTTPHPKAVVSSIVAVTTKNEVVGDTYRIVVNYVDDSNYHYADLLIGATSVTISLYKRSAGSNVLLIEDTLGDKELDTRTFTVCFSADSFTAEVTNPIPFGEVWTTIVTPHANGFKVGLGNGGTTVIYMDDFLFSEHYVTNTKCPRCRCWCQSTVIPKTLTATFSGTGQLTCADGFTITLNWRRNDGNWYGTGIVCGVTWELLLLCAEEASGKLATDFRLQISSVEDCCSADPSGCDQFAAAGSTCSPINLLFGPFDVPMGDLSCTCCDRTPLVMDSTYSWTVTA